MDIYQIHIETLKLIDAEMQRLHILIQRDDDNTNVDTCQEQLGELQGALIRLSAELTAKECE